MAALPVLVVDDHASYCEAFCHLLQECFPNLHIMTACDGSTALRLTQEIPFVLLVLDYQLPTISGGDVLRQIRMRCQTRGIGMPPAVLMSAQPDVSRFVGAVGAQAFLPKPATEEAITVVIGPLLSPASNAVGSSGPRLWRIQPRTAS